MNPIRFDLDQGTFSISNGTEGAWSWEDIAGCEVLNEEARFHKSSPPFSHRVYGGGTAMPLFAFGDPGLYVGLRITLKDGQELAAYVSEKSVHHNTDPYFADRKEAEKIAAALTASEPHTA